MLLRTKRDAQINADKPEYAYSRVKLTSCDKEDWIRKEDQKSNQLKDLITAK